MGAILRLVHTAAAFGRHVIVSSATLNDTLRRIIVQAWRSGLEAYHASLGKAGEASAARVLMISHALQPRWADLDDEQALAEFSGALAEQAQARTATPRRAFVQAIRGDNEASWMMSLAAALKPLHEGNRFELAEGKRFSWGLIRVARIRTCVEVARFLAERAAKQPPSRPLRLMTYHAREPLMRRSAKEEWLDQHLKRKSDDWKDRLAALVKGELGNNWDQAEEVVFIVVATPVEEVGRDHDFDWAIIEPSSMHSIIQTAGRVNRHRRQPLPPAVCNVAVLDQNRRALENNHRLAFVQPGFEAKIDDTHTTHPSHKASELLQIKEGESLDIGQRLIFGQNKRDFQVCDEKGQSLELEHLADKMQAGSVLWWSQWPAKRYPLREDSKEIEFSLRFLDSGQAKVLRHNGKDWIEIATAARIDVPDVALGERAFGYPVIWTRAQKQARTEPAFWVVSGWQTENHARLDWTAFHP
ncbi:MAG: hypothetical protein N2690_07470 [Rhodocyclaceae bacterium]|nr:hypothetical protein [Rhodocyclaceae bacterium]